MKARLTKRRDGQYHTLTRWPATIEKVGRVGPLEAYPQPGDPIHFHDVCQFLVDSVLPEASELRPLHEAKLWLTGFSYDHPEQSAKRLVDTLPEPFLSALKAAIKTKE